MSKQRFPDWEIHGYRSENEWAKRRDEILAPRSKEDRERVQTWLEIGRQNLWIRAAWDPPFDEISFHLCQDVRELADRILRGNWSLGQAFALGEIAFINQVNGGGEWLTIKGETSFESITMQTYQESRQEAEERLFRTVERIQAATEEQCKKLDY